MSRLICPMCLTGYDHLRHPAEIADPVTGCLAPIEGDGILSSHTVDMILGRGAILHEAADTPTTTKCGQMGYSTGADECVNCPECLGIEVTAYVSTVDGQNVIQIDTVEETGRFRINLNDAPIWDGDPNTDERPGANFKEV